MIEELTSANPRVLGFRLSGTLHAGDYGKFVPLIDEVAKNAGKVRLLAQFHDFQGWDRYALWADIKFSTTHCTTIEMVALVGDTTWEKWMASLCKPFTMAKVQYFDTADIDKAWAWINEG